MTLRLVTALALILVAVACLTAAAIVRWQIIEDAVSRAPEGHRFGLMRWYSRPNNTMTLVREHRRLYPQSRLRRRLAVLALTGGLLGISAWVI
jgi:hypothetical protein